MKKRTMVPHNPCSLGRILLFRPRPLATLALALVACALVNWPGNNLETVAALVGASLEWVE